MRTILLALALIPLLGHSQKGPGGVGSTDGTSNLDFWLDANTSVYSNAGTTLALPGQSVQQWNDQSGNSNNAIQNIGKDRPTYTPSTLNGYPVIDFDGILTGSEGDRMSFSYNSSKDATLFIVAEGTYGSSSAPRQLINLNAGGAIVLEQLSTSFLRSRYFSSSSNTGLIATPITDGVPFIAQYDFNAGGTSEMFNLGTSVGTATANAHSGTSGRVYIGDHSNAPRNWDGGIAEIISFKTLINDAQKIIIWNYLAAKYNLSLTDNDIYDEDESGSGNYDHDVAGIGRVNASNIHNEARGTGIVSILNPSNLGDNEFLIWGHNNDSLQATEKEDIPTTLQARLARVWRASESSILGASVDVGSINMQFDLSNLGVVVPSDLRLLVDTDNDGLFSDETPIDGATLVSGNIYQFTGVTEITDNVRFTIGTINIYQTPLPIELVHFNASAEEDQSVKLGWATATEINNDFFTIERSNNGTDWMAIETINGAGNSAVLLNYNSFDHSPLTGTSYYRLKQTDFDGQFSYSSISSIRILNKQNTNLTVYPNPAHNQITITGEQTALNQVDIYNILGENVTSRTNDIGKDSSKRIIDLSYLSAGVYFVKTEAIVIKVYKQ